MAHMSRLGAARPLCSSAAVRASSASIRAGSSVARTPSRALRQSERGHTAAAAAAPAADAASASDAAAATPSDISGPDTANGVVIGEVIWAGPKGAKVSKVSSGGWPAPRNACAHPHACMHPWGGRSPLTRRLVLPPRLALPQVLLADGTTGFMPSREGPYSIREAQDSNAPVRPRWHRKASPSGAPCPVPPSHPAPAFSRYRQGAFLPKGLVRPFKVISTPGKGGVGGKPQTGPLLSARACDLDVLWQRAAQLCDVSVQVRPPGLRAPAARVGCMHMRACLLCAVPWRAALGPARLSTRPIPRRSTRRTCG